MDLFYKNQFPLVVIDLKKIQKSKVKVDSIMKVAEIEEAEKMKMKKKVDKILKYKPDIFINR